MTDEYSVCQFFHDGSYEYLCRLVSPEDAIKTFERSITSLGARIGTTARVIITDGGDLINMEWVYGRGIVFPPRSVQ